MCAFVVLGSVVSTPSQEIGLGKCLRNDLFCVEWDVKPHLSQSTSLSEHVCDVCVFRLRVDKRNVAHTCGFASEHDATGSDLDLWMPQTNDSSIAIDTAKYIVSHVGTGFCELIEQEKSAMSWMSPGGTLAHFSLLSPR